MITLDILFIVRSCVQGMGKPMLPMVSGILEMVLRIFVISFFIGRVGFRAASYAEIAAWTGALLINIYAFCITLVPLLQNDRDISYCKDKSLHRRATT